MFAFLMKAPDTVGALLTFSSALSCGGSTEVMSQVQSHLDDKLSER